MKKTTFKANPFDVELKFFLNPITGQFNIYPFSDGVSSISDSETNEVVKKYKRRFHKAWEELAER